VPPSGEEQAELGGGEQQLGLDVVLHHAPHQVPRRQVAG
jgi:hypothetical protein